MQEFIRTFSTKLFSHTPLKPKAHRDLPTCLFWFAGANHKTSLLPVGR